MSILGAIATVGSAILGSRSADKASDRAQESTERAQDLLKESRDRARQDVLRIFPEAMQAQTQGFQRAQDFLAGQVLPNQAQAFQTGNMQAQETLLAGLPQIQNAILGGNVDLSGLQARSTPFNAFVGEFKPFVSRETSSINPVVQDGAQITRPQFDFLGGAGAGNNFFDFTSDFR